MRGDLNFSHFSVRVINVVIVYAIKAEDVYHERRF